MTRIYGTILFVVVAVSARIWDALFSKPTLTLKPSFRQFLSGLLTARFSAICNDSMADTVAVGM
jgi:hypothetical protein